MVKIVCESQKTEVLFLVERFLRILQSCSRICSWSPILQYNTPIVNVDTRYSATLCSSFCSDFVAFRDGVHKRAFKPLEIYVSRFVDCSRNYQSLFLVVAHAASDSISAVFRLWSFLCWIQSCGTPNEMERASWLHIQRLVFITQTAVKTCRE